MDPKVHDALKHEGYRVGSTSDFLGLTPEEAAFIELRLNIVSLVKSKRHEIGWTQQTLAQAIGSSQSRIAKLERGDPGISLDLMIKALLHLGASKEDIGACLQTESVA